MHINWKKIILITTDVALAAYLVVAVSAFNKPDETYKVCTQVNINIQDESTNGFINTSEIKSRLQKRDIYPLTKQLKDVNTREIESLLKSTPFVKTADCYKTQGGKVIITISQRLPIVRIKATNGDDYYLDDNNQIMPGSHYTSDLIIATGNISKSFAANYISYLSNALMDNDLWRNQIEQINVLPDYSIELIPRVGDHIINLGALPEIRYKKQREPVITAFVEKKMDRLEKFYKYGLSQAGWNKYSYINLEFDNQIICTKKDHIAHDPQLAEQAPAPETVNKVTTTEPATKKDDKEKVNNDNGDNNSDKNKETVKSKEKAVKTTPTTKKDKEKTISHEKSSKDKQTKKKK